MTPPGAAAAGPLAPVQATALTAAASRDAPGWRGAAAEFIDGLPAQRSLLALAASIDELLAGPQVVEAHGARLHDALLRDLGPVVERHPLIAASRLEGAVRLAIADAVAPFAVLGRLTDFPPGTPEEFIEALPRLVGAAMDRWAGELALTTPLRGALDRLRHEEAAAVDAAFELACDDLRAALTATEMPAVLEALTAARSRFATVDAAEQARHDARAHAAVCDAVLAFAAQDRRRLADAADRLTAALDQRSAWLRGTHRPQWLRPRHAAEPAWRRVVLLLRAASDRLAETIWMDVWEALGAVLDAYTQVRTLQPLPGAQAAPGLAVVVEPTIENAIVRSQSRLAALRRTVVEASAAENPPLPPRTAELLLSRIETAAADRRPALPQASRTPPDVDEDEDSHAAVARAHRAAPALVRVLGERQAAGLTAGLGDEDLRLLDGVVHSSEIARSRTAHPVLDPLLDRLLGQLADSPEFTGRVRATFGLLLEQTLRFLVSRADLEARTWGGPDADYRRALREGERRPREAELQRDYHQWLATGQLGGLVAVEVGDVAQGRADVATTFGSLRYVTEVKRELRDASREHLEAAHLAQAAEYGGANVPFGQLLVLDLTPHPRGAPRVDERVWLARHRPPGSSTDRFVVVGVVTGNRRTPHQL
ncbi:hypothetical protein [Saccharopolyspora mangrovi]|uniref:DUF3883 domain-containing protein n=1 Tax=Saccharopolyspora mangrovi TaxID=3082379 RepID=A0ABU6AEK2_9PSEU|nr:hypothetical protein [Saccharopolyspora sp. S2-29]MEB3369964.1 hypothetical protein [Saccharopolyspora sp. S2-29]